MQSLTETPRQTLTAAQVTYLLKSSPSLKVSTDIALVSVPGNQSAASAPGNDIVLDTVTQVFSVEEGTVTCDTTAKVQKSIQLTMDGANAYSLFAAASEPGSAPTAGLSTPTWGGRVFVPRMTLTDPDTRESAVFYLGAYILGRPSFDIEKLQFQQEYSVTCYDLTSALDVPYQTSLTVGAGTYLPTYFAFLISLFLPIAAYTRWNNVVIDGPPRDPTAATTTIDYTFDPGSSTGLDIINALLDIGEYEPLWSDEYGNFHITPHQPIASRAVSLFLDTADRDSIIDPVNTQFTNNVQDAKSQWIFTQSNYTGAVSEGAGQVTVNPTATNPNGQPSPATQASSYFGTLNIGRASLTATTQANLAYQAQRIVDHDQAGIETIQLSTSPWPLIGHRDDLIEVSDTLGLTDISPWSSGFTHQFRFCWVTGWALPLTGGNMSWTLGVVAEGILST